LSRDLKVSGRRPKLIGTDLDGTIVAHYGFISERTKIALSDAHKMGIHIYFVTGRPIRWMVEIKENFNFGLGICTNGALLYDFINEKVLQEWPFTTEAVVESVNRLRKVIPPISFAIEVGDEFHREESYIPRPVLKLLAKCSNGEFSSDEMMAIADKELAGVATATHSNSTDSLLEISAYGVSKGATLAKMAAVHGLTAADCVTFGDNPNDFSMLKWADRSWAMADGHPDLLKFSKFQTDPHQEDGVAKVIERLLELPY
jgi:HAD superfamily hydrolase (TIGR01484 family)